MSMDGRQFLNALWGRRGGVAIIPPPLDEIIELAEAAYSLRLLREAYTGDAVRIRRSSDDAEQDIGFDGDGHFDVAAFETFVGVGDGFVTAWYDQGVNGNDLAQNTAANQPSIVTDAVNGRAAVDWPEDRKYLVGSTIIATADDFDVYAVATGAALAHASAYKILFSFGDHGSGFWAGRYVADSRQRFDIFNNSTGVNTEDNSYANSGEPAKVIRTCKRVDVSVDHYWDSEHQVGSAATDMTAAMSTGGAFTLGYTGNLASARGWEGHIPEIIVFNQELSVASVSTMEEDQADYYGITLV